MKASLLSFFKRRCPLAAMALVCGIGVHVEAGGGGENLLLIVNPSDEPSLRIANAYIAARKIPSNNVLYITPPIIAGYAMAIMHSTDFTNTYQTSVLNAITARGLTNQVDYIGTIGQPTRVYSLTQGQVCVNNCLNHLTQLKNGLTLDQIVGRVSELVQNPELGQSVQFNYTPGSNTAIHHTQMLPTLSGTNGPPIVQWYMSGTVDQAGEFGLTTKQVIQNIQRTVAGDGKKPAGSIYFENNSDIRSSTRSPFWPPVQNYMSAHGIPWIQEENAKTPVNVKNVRGAEIGYAIINYSASMYVPGAWADSLTSYGGDYVFPNLQTTACNALLAGCGGSSGTVVEPYAIADRFPYASLWVYQNDGSTLGEAFYKSVVWPDLLMFQGDLLSQAYADVPSVTLTSGPADGATVSGMVSLSASASLNAPQTATGIARLELFVDGLDTGTTVSGSSGTLSWNTTVTDDGVHEMRVVAYNNSQAASEGCFIENLVVNNQGQSVSVVCGTSFNVSSNQVLSVPVSGVKGSGSGITSIQLQSYGRVVGSISGSSGNIALDATLLAFEGNVITPVAILASGRQVVGMPITVTRQFQQIAGAPVTPKSNRNPGFDYYYYDGAAGKTLATTNFSGTPTYVQHSNICQITPADPNPALWNLPSAYRTTAGGSSKGLAIMIKGSFNVTQPGEYSFFENLGSSWHTSEYTSGAILVDGVTLTSYDLWNGSSFVSLSPPVNTLQQLRTIYLLPGEHTVTIQLAQYNSGVTDAQSYFLFYFRGLQAQSSIWYTSSATAAGPFFYTVKNKVGS